MDAVRSPIESNIPASAAQPPAGPDLLKLLWRWKWLPILGAAIGMTISYLVYSQALPQYRATALVQVETRKKNIPMENNSNGPVDMGSPINDELVLIKSLVVLQRAIELGKFESHRRLAAMSPEKLIKYLKKIDSVRLFFNRSNFEKLWSKIETENSVYNKKWLLKKMEEMAQ